MRLSVLSYNVLHSVGAARLLKARAPGARSPLWAADRLSRAAELVRRLEPDIACLQEVDEAAEAALDRALGQDYERLALMRNEDLPPRDGLAAFGKKGRFQVAADHHLRLRDSLARHFPEEQRAKASGLAAALWRELSEKLNLLLALRLQAAPQNGGPALDFCLATTHLFWDPKYPDLKLLQAYLLAKELQAFAGPLPTVLAGDLNSTPFLQDGAGTALGLSGVYGLLTQGRVGLEHPHHPVTLRKGRGILRGVLPEDVPVLDVQPFRSAYLEAQGVEGPVTNAARDFRGCLDYIFYREGQGSRLRLLKVRPLPSEQELEPQLPLPSEDQPSDHLPIWADFELTAQE